MPSQIPMTWWRLAAQGKNCSEFSQVLGRRRPRTRDDPGPARTQNGCMALGRVDDASSPMIAPQQRARQKFRGGGVGGWAGLTRPKL